MEENEGMKGSGRLDIYPVSYAKIGEQFIELELREVEETPPRDMPWS